MSAEQEKRPTGMVAFIIIWIGQFVSLLGTEMTNFALTIWAYETTGQATALALVGFFYITPLLFLSPFAGALVDRSSRKMMMIVSDAGAGVSTIIVLALYSFGMLEVWHLYITSFIAGATQTFQWPAYSASISTMLPKEQYGRANGLISLSNSGSRIFAPVAAAALLGLLGLRLVLWIDVITFTFAIGSLLFAVIPQPKKSAEGEESAGSFWSESMFGFRYILKRKSLLGLQIVFMVGNFFATMAFTLIAPMILARTGNDELILGSTQSAGAIGGVIGGLIMGAWGGPKKLVHGVLLGWFLSGLLGVVPMGIGQTWIVWAGASFVASFIIPILNGSNQAIWQRKVPPDLQGRVFSIRRLIAWLVNPIATLLVGPLADFVMEPAMQTGGWLAPTFGWLVGSGPGAGMALVVIGSGIMAALCGLVPYTIPLVRDVEERMPDYEEEPRPATIPA